MSLPSWAQQASFVENQGQWEGDFNYKLSLGNGAVFIAGNKVVYHFGVYDFLSNPSQSKNEKAHPGLIPMGSPFKGHAYSVSFLGSSKEAIPQSSLRRNVRENYILGKDRSKWKSDVGLFGAVKFSDIYPGIDVKYYFNRDQNLKYDLILKAGADPDLIKLEYEGADRLKLVYGNLLVKNSVEDVLESAPVAYQMIEGEKVSVKCKYVLKENILSYKLGSYNEDYELVIDPVLIFSTYSGSKTDNFGFTATYGIDGEAYGGGIAYNSNPNQKYPVTLGAYQDTFRGGTYDVTITKYTADGSEMIFSTYLGGAGNEVPLSLIETRNKELLILGTTGSANFPTSVLTYDSTFNSGTAVSFSGSIINYPNGADVFITKLDSTGGQLLSSTYFGGSGNDGVNSAFRFNYADENRSEIALDSLGNVYIAATSDSRDIPSSGVLSPSGIGYQDGLIASFNPELKNLRWASYIAGSDHDAALSLKTSAGQVYVVGITASSDLGTSFSGGFESQFLGNQDGYVLRMKASDGQINAFTYNGTSSRDRNFLMDLDEDNNVYVFGHSMGRYPVLGSNVFSQPNGNQFVNKFNSDLSQSLKSMIFGNMDSSKTEVSPTAFMVDNCRNMYLSGYGRNGGLSSPQGLSNGLPITNNIDEVQGARANSDGQDFYFMVLDASWEKVNFGAYFGERNGSGDHVDGGTSRFQKDGTIYQAVCASCGGTDKFPVSDSAYSILNGSSNCNMAVLKLRMELDVSVEFEPDRDSSCVPYTVNLINKSYNADIYQTTLPDGSILQNAPAQIVIDQLGVQYLNIIARDTTCGFEDSVRIEFYGYIDPLDADFSTDYDTCDGGLSVEFKNESTDANAFYWDFGDGNFSIDENPVHLFDQEGTYTVQMIVSGGSCGNSDSSSQVVTVRSSSLRGDFRVNYDPCADGTSALFDADGGGFQQNIWSVDNQVIGDSMSLKIDFKEPGTYEVKLESIDTVCNRVFTHRESITILDFDSEIVVPNVFSPNGDLQNDVLHFTSIQDPDFFSEFDIKIFNRWGSELFSNNSPVIGWDGRFENNDVPQGVYYYVLTYSDQCGNKEERTGFFHLFR